jgi:hypothetical protein
MIVVAGGLCRGERLGWRHAAPGSSGDGAALPGLMRTKSPGEQALVLRGDEDNYGQSALVHLATRPDAAVVGEHLHLSSPSGSGSSPAGSERGSWAGSAPWWPAKRAPSSVSRGRPGSR